MKTIYFVYQLDSLGRINNSIGQFIADSNATPIVNQPNSPVLSTETKYGHFVAEAETNPKEARFWLELVRTNGA